MSPRTTGLISGSVVVLLLIAVRVISAYEDGGVRAAVVTIVVAVILIAVVVFGALLAQTLVTRGRAATAIRLRPDARVLLIGETRHGEFGLSRAALMLGDSGLELVALPGGRWSERMSVSDVSAVEVESANALVNWSTEFEVTPTSGPAWIIAPDGWRILPHLVLRAQAERARDEILARTAHAKDLEGKRTP